MTDLSRLSRSTLERWLRILIDAGQFGAVEQIRRELSLRKDEA